MHQLLVSKFSYMTIDCKIDPYEVYMCRFCLNSMNKYSQTWLSRTI